MDHLGARVEASSIMEVWVTEILNKTVNFVFKYIISKIKYIVPKYRVCLFLSENTICK